MIQLYMHMHILFYILFHCGLLQDIEYSSLCHTGTLLFICFIGSSLDLLNPDSEFIPPPPSLPWGAVGLLDAGCRQRLPCAQGCAGQ